MTYTITFRYYDGEHLKKFKEKKLLEIRDLVVRHIKKLMEENLLPVQKHELEALGFSNFDEWCLEMKKDKTYVDHFFLAGVARLLKANIKIYYFDNKENDSYFAPYEIQPGQPDLYLLHFSESADGSKHGHYQSIRPMDENHRNDFDPQRSNSEVLQTLTSNKKGRFKNSAMTRGMSEKIKTIKEDKKVDMISIG